MSRDWGEFVRFEAADDKYLPMRGEGETIASQITTAVSKLVYKWYNDGDVFDNTHHLGGWCNDLSSYANWLYENIKEARPILLKIESARTDGDYEDLLYELCEATQMLDFLATKETEKVGTVYKCDGPFRYREHSYDDWDFDDDYE